MSGERILVVEVCPARRRILAQHLRTASESYNVTTVEDIDEAAVFLSRPRPHLVLLSCLFGTTDAPGLGPCRELRRRCPSRGLGILVIARDLPVGEECGAVHAGADGCLHSASLTRLTLQGAVARVLTAIVQRRGEVLESGPFTLVRSGRRVRMDGDEVRLSPLEFALFWRLAEAPGTTFSYSELLEHGEGSNGGPLHLRVFRLRKKLGSWGGLIKTARSRGYYLEPDRLTLS